MKKIFLLVLSVFTVFVSFAAVEFDPQSNTILVSGYPENSPCDMKTVHRMDILFKWGKVTFDETSESWNVNCNLMIGDNNGTTTYFQIGTEKLPNETVIVNGCVRVKSIWLEGENAKFPWHKIKSLRFVNRLTIGNPLNSEIKATLKVNNDGNQGHNLVIGGYDGYSSVNYGGQLHIYNGTFESARNAPLGAGGKSSYGAFAGGSRSIVMENARFANINGGFARNFTSGTFEHTVFDRSGFSGNYQEIMTGCVFENNSLGINCIGTKNLALYDCIFRNNKIDWRLYTSRIVAIDCEYNKAPEKNLYIKTARGTPYFVSKRHIIVKVVDANGKAINKATVKCTPDTDIKAPEYDVFYAVTGKKGSTPEKGNPEALLLTQTIVQGAANKNEAPSRKDVNYKIEVSVNNKKAVKENFIPAKSWETLVISLK